MAERTPWEEAAVEEAIFSYVATKYVCSITNHRRNFNSRVPCGLPLKYRETDGLERHTKNIIRFGLLD